jgi:dolichyl-phosphate beta-glucosyltransferase
VIYLSLIIPLYNEEQRLVQFLPTLILSVQRLVSGKELEVVLVNDGSTDSTRVLMEQAKIQFGEIISCVDYPINRGKGFAIKEGVSAARGKYVCFMDIDLSVNLDVLPKTLDLLEDGVDVVSGSRRMIGSTIAVSQDTKRVFMGKVYVYLTNFILATKYSDITCGFKAFSYAAATTLFSKLTCYRWSFDAEILFLAKKNKLRVVEIPVIWKNDFNSKVRLTKDVLTSFIELILIRWRAFTGVYEK